MIRSTRFYITAIYLILLVDADFFMYLPSFDTHSPIYLEAGATRARIP